MTMVMMIVVVIIIIIMFFHLRLTPKIVWQKVFVDVLSRHSIFCHLHELMPVNLVAQCKFNLCIGVNDVSF